MEDGLLTVISVYRLPNGFFRYVGRSRGAYSRISLPAFPIGDNELRSRVVPRLANDQAALLSQILAATKEYGPIIKIEHNKQLKI